MLGLLEPQVLKRATAIFAAVDPIAEPNVTTSHVFASTNPHGIALLRIDRNASDRIGRLIIEDGSKRGTSIGRFPQITRSDSDVPSVGLLGIESDIGDSTCHKGRPDASEFDGAN